MATDSQPSSTSTRLFPKTRPTLALQLTHIHLALKWGGVKAINHFGTGSGIARQDQGVHRSAKQQSEHDAAVAQAVQGSCFTCSAEFEARDF